MDAFDPADNRAEPAASQWLARRDRSLSPAEQDAYLQWLRENPANGPEFARLERSWHRLDALRDWHPAHSSHPNPELLAAPKRRRWIWGAMAAAAAIALAAVMWWSPATEPARPRGAIVHPGPRHLALEDGSLVELNDQARIEVNFTPERRDVRLLQGEAHFIVAKNPNRPFVVAAVGFTVRAVGTAFDVHLQDKAISVLVTEGNVQLGESRVTGQATLLSRLTAGQEATVIRHPARPADSVAQVRELTPAEVDAALAWQSLRLEFVEMPLRQVVAEFNRYNSRKLLIEDAHTGDIVVGGTFRADNVEAFVRLLDVGFGVRAHAHGEDIVLVGRN